MLNAGSTVTAVARSLNISRQSVYRIKTEVEAAQYSHWGLVLSDPHGTPIFWAERSDPTGFPPHRQQKNPL